MARSSLAAGDRAQTAHDFSIGMGIFLLTIAFVFAFIPTVFAPFSDPGHGGVNAQAQEATSVVLGHVTVDGSSTELDKAATEAYFADLRGGGVDLVTNVSLKSYANANVTIETLDGDAIVTSGGTTLAAGDEYENQAGAVTTRIVTIPGHAECATGCRLTVRVW